MLNYVLTLLFLFINITRVRDHKIKDNRLEAGRERLEVTIGTTISDVAVKFDEAVFKGIIHYRVVSVFLTSAHFPLPVPGFLTY
ncbi:hypothetical protein [Chryseobacterium sp. StRB126]|uniref:hypothetical protein n=1 Tax=Chryseobacterium sp. StRB126 TaxID=878220 RepID=UPI0005EE9175|nr:hypothetical protein [Chryseobacterium sp. StRB126]